MFLIRRLAQMTRGGIAGLLAVLVLAGVAVFFWVAHTINTAPAQCATCHPELTAMWHRSQGHPADRVTCYECHAQHAEAPSSLNVGAFVRDQLIPEKYLSSDERIQGRCEGCHDQIRASGIGRELVAAKYALREASAVASQLDASDRKVALGAEYLNGEAGEVGAERLLLGVVRSLRDREWRAAAQTGGVGNELSALRKDLEAVASILSGEKVSEDLLAGRMGQRLEERLQQVRDGADATDRSLAGVEELLGTAAPGKKLSAKLQTQLEKAITTAADAVTEVTRARISIGRILDSESAVADPRELKSRLDEAAAAVSEGQGESALVAVRAARELLKAPMAHGDVIEQRVRELSAANLARVTASVESAVTALGAVASDLPDEGTSGGNAIGVRSAILRPWPRAEEGSAKGPRGAKPESPADLAATAAKGLESVGGAVKGIAELEYADLGLEPEKFGAVAERLGKLSAAFAAEGAPAQAKARLRGYLETALFELPAAEEEDRLVLVLTLDPLTAGAPATLDLGDLLAAGTAPFRELEFASEREKVIQVNHKLHLVSARDELGQPLGLGCLSCHRNIAHDKAQVETNRPTMAGCFTGECHRKDRNKDNCRRCHYQQLTEPGQEVL